MAQMIENELDRCAFPSSVFTDKTDDHSARDLKGNVVKQEARAYRARMRWLKNAQVSEPVTEGGNDHE